MTLHERSITERMTEAAISGRRLNGGSVGGVLKIASIA